MTAYLFLPIAFVRFWFVEAPIGMLHYYWTFNRSLVHILSLPVLFATFFKPLKNEYREGLVGFSIGMGIFVKTSLIIISLFLFLGVFLFEFLSVVLFVFLPFLAFLVLFGF